MIDLTRPPQTPDLPVYKLPSITAATLPNGLEVIFVGDNRFPLVTARLGFSAGSKFDPEDLPGVSEMTGALLTEGTRTRTAQQIAEEIASIGGSIRADSSADSLLVAGNCLAEYLPRLLRLIADVARNANFPDDEVELRKQNRAQELAAQRAQAAYLADEKMNEVVFGSHPYSRQEPTFESIARMDATVLAGFRDRFLGPNNGVLILLGSIPPEQTLMKMVEDEFGDWQKTAAPGNPTRNFPAPRRHIALVDRPGSVQADIRICRTAVSRSDPEYFPLLLGNTILGGGASSRIFMNIREKQGFAYDAGSTLRPLKDGGLFSVVTQVRNEVIEPAMEAALEELRRIGSEAVSADELSTAKNYLSGVFVIRLETQDGLANQLIATRLMGLPFSYLEKYTERVRAVEPDAIQEAAKHYMDPQACSIVLVGDASQAARELGKFGEVQVEQAD